MHSSLTKELYKEIPQQELAAWQAQAAAAGAQPPWQHGSSAMGVVCLLLLTGSAGREGLLRTTSTTCCKLEPPGQRQAGNNPKLPRDLLLPTQPAGQPPLHAPPLLPTNQLLVTTHGVFTAVMRAHFLKLATSLVCCCSVWGVASTALTRRGARCLLCCPCRCPQPALCCNRIVVAISKQQQRESSPRVQTRSLSR